MSWSIAAIVGDDATASILVERAWGPVPGQVASLPIAELPVGRRTGEDICTAVEGLLGRSIDPFWLRSSESDDASESGEGVIITLADRAQDAPDARSFTPVAGVVD